MNKKNEYVGIGLMSGTSLDGLDIAFCRFNEKNDNTWDYHIEQTHFVPYPEPLYLQLNGAKGMAADALMALDASYGRWLGLQVHQFVSSNQIKPSFVASHGYTVFHQPERGFTLQIGNGHEIFSECQIPVVYQFRQLDVALGGQGAPLVPIGDRLLFGEYDFCLNLGGIANLSTQIGDKRVAYDVCPANMILNHQAKRKNRAYDKDGNMAASGGIIQDLLYQLEKLHFYTMPFPKSLGSEWVEQNILHEKVLNTYSPEDVLATFTHHITNRLATDFDALAQQQPASTQAKKIQVTGGGAFNTHLIHSLKRKLGDGFEVIVPDEKLVNFKEALIFAFLGLLKQLGRPNCLASATGARYDCSGGIVVSNVIDC